MQTLWLRSAHGSFSLPCFQARCGHPLGQALPLRVARQNPTLPARCSRTPPSLGWALGPGPRVTGALYGATMGSEMEPLLRAWSYFRRRKFQLCADLCTQMLEKSPYDQVSAGPRQSVDSLAMAMGSGGSLCPLGEAWEEGPRQSCLCGPQRHPEQDSVESWMAGPWPLHLGGS